MSGMGGMSGMDGWTVVREGEAPRDTIVGAGFRAMDRIGIRYRDEQGEEREAVGFYGPGIGVIVNGTWIGYERIAAFRRGGGAR